MYEINVLNWKNTVNLMNKWPKNNNRKKYKNKKIWKIWTKY